MKKLLLLLIVLCISCSDQADKINGKWSGASSDRKYSFLIKETAGKISGTGQANFGGGSFPIKIEGMIVNYDVSLVIKTEKYEFSFSGNIADNGKMIGELYEYARDPYRIVFIRDDYIRKQVDKIDYSGLTEFECFRLANEQYGSEEYANAIGGFRFILEKFPKGETTANSTFMLGFIFANSLENYEEAKKYYTLFIERYPDHDLAEDAQYELETLGQDINDMPIFKDVDEQ